MTDHIREGKLPKPYSTNNNSIDEALDSNFSLVDRNLILEEFGYLIEIHI